MPLPRPVTRLFAAIAPGLLPFLVGAGVYVLSGIVEPAHPWPAKYARTYVEMSNAPLAFEGPMPERLLGPLLAWLVGLSGDGWVRFTELCAVLLLGLTCLWCRRRGAAWPDAVLVTAAVGCTGMVQVYKAQPGFTDTLIAALLVGNLLAVRRAWAFWGLHLLNLLNHGLALFFVPWLLWLRRTFAGARWRVDLAGAAATTLLYALFRSQATAGAPAPGGHQLSVAHYWQQLRMLVGPLLPWLYVLAAVHCLIVFGPLLALPAWHARARPADRPGSGLLLVLAAIGGILLMAHDAFRFANFAFLPLLLASVRFLGTARSRAVYAVLLAGAVVSFELLHREVLPHFWNVALQCDALRDRAALVTCVLPRTWPILLAFASAAAALVWLGRWLHRRGIGAPAAAAALALVPLAAALLPAGGRAQQPAPPGYARTPVPFDRVRLDDGFWRPRLEVQRRVLLPHAFERTAPAVAYLQAAADHLAGRTPEDLPPPQRYLCSDLYKVLEGAAYLLALERDPGLEARIDAIAAVIAAAQREDGYLYCAHVLGHGSAAHGMGDGPYEHVVHSHELYNLGHLYEAAVALARATGKQGLLAVAERSARHVGRVFFAGDPAYRGGRPVNQAPGHQEIELALVRLAQHTGERAYLETARRLLDVRGVTYVPDGTGVMAPTYAQQHLPVREQRQPVGHAVRAAYMYCGMADVDAMSGTRDYTDALSAIWRDVVDTRMHLTGGLGAVHGIEGFGPPFVLPNAEAYAETCAAVGNVLWNLRMFRLHGDARFLDVAEVALCNNVLAGVALAGDRFFYVNPLEHDGETAFNHGSNGRAPWFRTACCPTNLARLLPQVPGMLYATDEDGLLVTSYAASETRVGIGGVPVGVVQHTGYPLDGRVVLRLAPERPVRFLLRLRVPTWTGDRFVPGELYRYADGLVPAPVRILLDGEPVDAPRAGGFAVLDRQWRAGDEVVLELPMPVRASRCDERVEADRGRVALTRGPLVLVVEEVDQGIAAQRLCFDGVPDLGGDRVEVAVREIAEGHDTVFATVDGLAVPPDGAPPQARRITMVPYYAWNNRGPGSMVTWIPTDPALVPRGAGFADPAFAAVRASHTWQGDRTAAIGDGRLPASSADTSIPRWTSWPQRGRPQQVEIRFDRERPLRQVGLYFYDDGGGVRLPAAWRLEVETGGVWRPLPRAAAGGGDGGEGGDGGKEGGAGADYPVAADRFVVAQAAPGCTAAAVRIHLVPVRDAAVGLLEVQVGFAEER